VVRPKARKPSSTPAPPPPPFPATYSPPNVLRVRDWFAPNLDALRVKLQDRFLILKRHQEAVAPGSGRHKAVHPTLQDGSRV